MPATVSQIWIYPVKSLKGIRLESSAVTSRGLAHDRRFMVVDPGGVFLTQRELPAMATVWTQVEGGNLLLAAPDHDEVRVPLEPATGEPCEVEVWDSTCRAIASGARSCVRRNSVTTSRRSCRHCSQAGPCSTFVPACRLE